MTNELRPVRCGCGGEAMQSYNQEYGYDISCMKCGIVTDYYGTEEEAITAWNRAMGNRDNLSPVERTAKLVPTIYKGWYRCECGKGIYTGQKYCSHCGARLEWNE